MLWVLKRIGVSLLLVWVVATHRVPRHPVVPGDPAELLLSQGGAAPDPAAVAQLRDQLGLDQPLLTQYVQNFGPACMATSGRACRTTPRSRARSRAGCRARWN